VDGISYTVDRGEIVALVGESGCGKSVSALAILRLLPKPAGRIAGGRVLFDGVDLASLPDDAVRARRGRDIGMVFQEPMTSLNPVLSVGLQITEHLIVHLHLSHDAARARAVELLTMVGMTDPERRLAQYPHELSGGMRQRVMIAIALACNPKLLIADEPTTALDVTIQAQILELMKDLTRRLGIGLVFITHNLGVVARYADQVTVMYAARQMERADAFSLFARPHHPYTAGLLRAVPRLDQPRNSKLETIEGLPPNLAAPPAGCRFAPRCSWRVEACARDPPLAAVEPGHDAACWRAAEVGRATRSADAPATRSREHGTRELLLRLECVAKHYDADSGLFGGRSLLVKAVDGVSLEIARGETLGLVGESGCGKTTVGRLIMQLERPTAGRVLFDGTDLATLAGDSRRSRRRQVQAVFQDPFSSLNPRMTVRQILGEPLSVYRLKPTRQRIRGRIAELLEDVGLQDDLAARYPHELSGGQRQRVGIARALAMRPSFIVCDEPVSALDVSIQGQVITLFEKLQAAHGLTYLFIAHDLAVVRHIAIRVAVMYLGRVMELAECDDLFAAPQHPYTQALLDAVPIPDPAIERRLQRRPLGGEIPSPLAPPSGCVFHTRCPLASAECRREVPELREIRPGQFAACLKAYLPRRNFSTVVEEFSGIGQVERGDPAPQIGDAFLG
jgi:peptide/nickel transport system ATP-binding protein